MFTHILFNAPSLLSDTVSDVSAGGLVPGDGPLSPAEKRGWWLLRSGSFSVLRRGLAGTMTPSGVRGNTADR